MSGYAFRGFRISEHMLDGIRRYIDQRIRPGGFLTAVIENNLREAVGCADDDNMANLPAFVAYFYNEAPGPCWGSPERMLAWLTAEPSTVGLAPSDADAGDPQGEAAP